MNTSEILSWAEMAVPLGEVGREAQFVIRALGDVIDAAVQKAFTELIPTATLAEVLGLNPEQATWDTIALYLRDLRRQAQQSASGQVPTSPAVPLVALSAGLPALSQPGVPRSLLALALGLAETASKAAVLAELERLHNLLHPAHEQLKELARRRALVGLSAGVPAATLPASLREKLLFTLCALGAPSGFAARRRFENAKFYLDHVADPQILALHVALLAATRRPALVTLRASAEARPGALPTRMRVLDWGRNDTLHGPVIVDERTLAEFDAHQRKTGRERVALDFEHNTVEGSPEYLRSYEPRAVAAFWTPRVVRGEGVVLESPTWTKSGEESSLNYEDISAAPYLVDGHVVGLHSVALTRAGASDFHFLPVPGFPGVTLSATSARLLGGSTRRSVRMRAEQLHRANPKRQLSACLKQAEAEALNQ